jgi:arginine decarboxylase
MLDHAETPLLTALEKIAQHPHAGFYTPGHKQGQGAFPPLRHLIGELALQADLPELPGLDNLFAPQEVILQAQELAAAAFGAAQTWFLANGSTCGIQAAILATCQPGDKILLPRNCHRSAIAALVLSGAVPVFGQPEYEADWDIAHTLSLATVQDAVNCHPDMKAVMLLHPTYYGVCGELGAIAQFLHQRGIPLLVDEAHGAHFAFHADLPPSALSLGADVTVQSIHKTLGSLTQSSMLHLGEGRWREAAVVKQWGDRLTQALQLVQSTSPNYLLLASLDAARQQMVLEGQQLMQRAIDLAKMARSHLSQIPGLRVLDVPNPLPGRQCMDVTRLTVDVRGLGITGFEADERLHGEFGVTVELPSLHHLTGIISLGNTEEDIQQLVQGFQALAQDCPVAQPPQGTVAQAWRSLPTPEMVCSPRDAFFAPSCTVPIHAAIAQVSAELVCPYPPGIPILVPGERITPEAIAYLQTILQSGGILTGCADSSLQTLKILASF